MSSLAVMQPYFFPYIGYFALIDSVDHFMFFDNVQYVRKSWMGRNRILNIDTGIPFYIRPGIIKPPYKAPLSNVRLEPDDDWKNKIIDQTLTYKNNTPFYSEAIDLLIKILEKDYQYLLELNIKSTMQICEELNIDTNIDKFSENKFEFKKTPRATRWASEVARRLSVREYINAPNGKGFIDKEGFEINNIKLGFIAPKITPYKQGKNNFIPRLSILDVLFCNGIEKTKKMVKKYMIEWVN